jgi:hypothetical protein
VLVVAAAVGGRDGPQDVVGHEGLQAGGEDVPREAEALPELAEAAQPVEGIPDDQE